ncbi:MAG: M81 family metallopeptidase [Anaerolineaceae bacterium]|nr:M81 family metallopeptidase [Anaerolineaceae bacterium]
MPRIALAGFMHETNTFAPLPTTYESFVASMAGLGGILGEKELMAFRGSGINAAAAGFIDQSEALGNEVIPLLFAAAQPAATVTDDAFDRITSMILERIQERGPFDAIFLDLHGAMVTESYQDPETEVYRRIRSIVGEDIPIVASLDLHGNIPQESVEAFSALVGYRTYPHVDMYETGERSANLMQVFLEKKRVKKAFRKLPYLISPSTASHLVEPCISIYKSLEKIEENDDVYSLTFMHGFLLSDIAPVGPSLFAYAKTQADAEAAVEELYQTLLSNEKNFALSMLSPEEAVQTAIQKAEFADNPIVLADVQDNAGGGGTSDTIWILDALIKNNAQDAALALMFDPQAAELIHTTGEGSHIKLELGGKLMPGHIPYTGTFLIEKLFEGEFDLTSPMNRGHKANLGKMALISIGGVKVVVASVRTQNNDQSYFRIMGIDPTKMNIVVVKSTNHYRAHYMPIAEEIIMVDAPGAHIEDPTKIPYVNLREGVRLGGLGPEFIK